MAPVQITLPRLAVHLEKGEKSIANQIAMHFSFDISIGKGSDYFFY